MNAQHRFHVPSETVAAALRVAVADIDSICGFEAAPRAGRLGIGPKLAQGKTVLPRPVTPATADSLQRARDRMKPALAAAALTKTDARVQASRARVKAVLDANGVTLPKIALFGFRAAKSADAMAKAQKLRAAAPQAPAQSAALRAAVCGTPVAKPSLLRRVLQNTLPAHQPVGTAAAAI